MPRVKILRHVLRDHFLIRHEQVEIPLALLGREFEGDVQKLAEARVEKRMLLIVPQRAGELRARPARDFLALGSFALSMSMTDAYGAQNSSTCPMAPA